MATKKNLINLLTNSLYYPACDIDGGVIKYCNEHYEEIGINSYVYADYGMEEKHLKDNLDSIFGYYPTKSRSISAADLGFDLSQLIPECSDEDKERIYFWRKNPFARYAVFERDYGFGPEIGPEVFYLLYLGAEGITVYEELYLANGIVPKALAIIQPGTAFGGNWTDYRDPHAPFARTVYKGERMPDYLFYGGYGLFSYEDLMWPGYRQIDAINRYYTDKDGRVTIWRRDNDSTSLPQYGIANLRR